MGNGAVTTARRAIAMVIALTVFMVGCIDEEFARSSQSALLAATAIPILSGAEMIRAAPSSAGLTVAKPEFPPPSNVREINSPSVGQSGPAPMTSMPSPASTPPAPGAAAPGLEPLANAQRPPPQTPLSDNQPTVNTPTFVALAPTLAPEAGQQPSTANRASVDRNSLTTATRIQRAAGSANVRGHTGPTHCDDIKRDHRAAEHG